jgi:hypothetical protein
MLIKCFILSYFLDYHATVTFVVHTCCGSGVCFLVYWFLSFVLCGAVRCV